MPDIPVDTIIKGTIVFLRISGILHFLPIFGEAPTPLRVRLLLAGALALVFYNLMPANWNVGLTYDVLSVGWLLFRELFVGFTLGFIAKLCFDGMLMAANLVGFQMGFGTADLFFMTEALQVNSFTAFHRVIVMMLFLGLDLHHVFIEGIADSFRLIPIGGVVPHQSLATLMISLTGGVFLIALQLAAPILIALMFTMAALGLIARTVPQLNVFTMSFPASFFIGLLIYIATFPLFPEWIRAHFMESQQHIQTALRGLNP
jgi:flagellar biosynthetic protein FliR